MKINNLVSLAAALAAAVMITSCATLAQKVASNTEIKLEKVQPDNPAGAGLNVVRELVGAVLGVEPSSRENDLALTVKLKLKNSNGFDLNLTKVSYTVVLENKIIATGNREGNLGELVVKSGEEKIVDLPVKVFTRETIDYVLAGFVKTGAKVGVRGRLTFDTVMGSVNFPYSVESEIK